MPMNEDEEYEKDADDDENLNAEETLSGIKVIKLKDGKARRESKTPRCD